MAAWFFSADFAERRHEVAVAQVALMDVGVGGAVDEQLAGHLPIRAAGGRTVEAQEPFVDEVFHLGRRRAGRQIAERAALVFGVGRVGRHDVAGEFPDVIERAEQCRVAGDGAEIGQLGRVDDAAVLRVAEQADHVVAIDEAVGVEIVAQVAQGGIDDVRVEPIGGRWAGGRRRRRRGRWACSSLAPGR